MQFKFEKRAPYNTVRNTVSKSRFVAIVSNRFRIPMSAGDAYQRAVLGIVDEGDSEMFAHYIAAAVAYAESWRASF